MATEYSGSGDPARSLALLWRSQERPTRKGRSSRLSVDRIVRVAVELVDADGLAALSMRRVAERLGVGTMSLYTYVPGKAELIDVMLDAVYGEPPMPKDPPGDWRIRLERIARDNRARYLRHPWMLQVATGRPVLGPNAIARYDYELEAVAGTGLTEIEMDSVVTLMSGYVHGAVRGAVDAAQAEQRTGMTDEQWWSAHAPILDRMVDPDRYPTATRVGSAAGAEHGGAVGHDHAFEFGLQRVLDGIDVLVRGRSAQHADGG